MGKVQIFRVEFDRPGATYSPGETVTGKVILSLSGSKNVREIRLEAKGEAEVHWTKTRYKSKGHITTDHYRGSETYFSVSNRLMGSTSDGYSTIPAGMHTYQFSFHVPSNIPCSFEHTLGFVRYTVKAVIDRPWRFDHKVVTAFTVVSDYDLNAQPSLSVGINDQMVRSFYSCCCLVMGGKLFVQVKSRVCGFVPGETIELIVSYDNKSDSAQLKKFKLYLIKQLQFFASSPLPDKKQTTEIIKLAKVRGPFLDKGETSIKIKIPPTPPSKLQHCTLINVEYKVALSMYTSGIHRNIHRSYPIEIGTVPIYYREPTSAPTAPPIDQVNVNSGLLPSQQQVGTPIGFVVMSTPPYMPQGVPPPKHEMPPPSYEECVSGSNIIADHNEEGMHGPNVQFSPKYPVYKFPMPMPHPP